MREIELLTFGDSNTYGYKPDGSGRFEKEIRWSGILSEKLKGKFHVIEEGLCGRTTVFEDETRIGRKGSDLLPVLLESHEPVGVVLLMLGTNDMKKRNHATAKDIGAGIEILLDQIAESERKSGVKKRVLLISPIHLGENIEAFDKDFSNEAIAVSYELAREYKKIAQKRKIDFLNAADYVEPSMLDREHFDANSHLKFAEVVYRKLKEMKISRENEWEAEAFSKEYVS